MDLTLRVGEARACDEIAHAELLAAGRELGLSEATADREIKQMILALPKTAAALNARLEIDLAGKAEKSTNSAAARLALVRDLRPLRAIEHMVIADMVRRVVH